MSFLRRIGAGAVCGLLGAGLSAFAHDVGPAHAHPAAPAAVPLRFEVERKGPVRAVETAPAGAALSGEGYWTFTAATNGVLPLPAETLPHLKGAHGTLIWDRDRDVVYWGLENVGWVAFSNRLNQSWVVRGDAALSKGNLHGADLWPRRGQLPLVAAADNVEGEVYLSDTSFQNAQRLSAPPGGAYPDRSAFHPTDTAFVDRRTLFVTDGYGQAYFMSAGVEPFAYTGSIFGGKSISQTPHGVTHDAAHKSLVVSARPEAQLKRWSLAKSEWLEVLGLPAGSTVCDVDLWGDYALAPCLDGPGGAPGPIYIVNLKKKAVVSTLRPKADLGFGEAQHIHDAMWYVVKEGRRQAVYVLFTNWNPGGIGALKLAQR